jgi:hypothetical protein
MSLLNPAGLIFLGILPFLVIAYLARERPRQVIVSSVLAFRALHVMRGERFGGRPRWTWTFFLELLVLGMAAFAIAGPYLLRRGSPIVVVLDNSAAMQAETAGGETRFQAAVGKIKDQLRSAGSSPISLYLTAPQPHQASAGLVSAREAISLLDHSQVLDTPDDSAAIVHALTDLNLDGRWGRILVAIGRPLAAPIPSRIRSILVGDRVPNYAIGSFSVVRAGLNQPQLKGQVTVANFSQSAKTLRVSISGDNKAIATEQAQLAAGEVKPLVFSVLTPARIYRAQLEPSDDFMLDNQAFATVAGGQNLSVLFVSPSPTDGESLTSIPGLVLTTRSPQQYTPKDLANVDLAIFQYSIPKELPPINTIFVMPPEDPVLGFVALPSSALRVTGWPSTDPLTDGVNFRLLNVRSGEYFGQHPWMQAVVHGAQGGLILAGDRQDHRYVATGFNPLPYLGKQNLPMSVLTLNLLNDLAGLGSQAVGYRTGDPWLIPAGVKEVIAPSGEKIPVTAGTAFIPDKQGIYELIGAAGNSPRAVNLSDLRTSDLQDMAPIRIETAPAGIRVQPNPVRTPLAPFLLAAIIGLIVLEALFVYRRRRLAEA